jgi:hypothetical protein
MVMMSHTRHNRSKLASDGNAKETGKIAIGMDIVSINGAPVYGSSLSDITAMISSSGRGGCDLVFRFDQSVL